MKLGGDSKLLKNHAVSIGWCEIDPDFCGPPNCVSTCDAKSEWDPGWGSSRSNNAKYPLNVCCAKVCILQRLELYFIEC